VEYRRITPSLKSYNTLTLPPDIEADSAPREHVVLTTLPRSVSARSLSELAVSCCTTSSFSQKRIKPAQEMVTNHGGLSLRTSHNGNSRKFVEGAQYPHRQRRAASVRAEWVDSHGVATFAHPSDGSHVVC